MARLTPSVVFELRLFAYLLANRTLARDVLGGVEYGPLFEEPSALEQAVAIFANNLVLDEDGNVPPGGAQRAARRAAEYIRSWVDPSQGPSPKFEAWEVELHGP